MENTNAKKEATIGLIDIMIQNADKGPSGFWVDDHEGCGNPNIFPEFEEGLRKGQLIQKEHYLCPWNTAILYGSKHGNIHTGCYHSCSIEDARYLSKDMLKKILHSFKKRVVSGNLDNLDQITPLLMKSDVEYIQHQKELERKAMKEEAENERKTIREKAAGILKRCGEWAGVIEANYGKKIVQMVEGGAIDFDQNGLKEVVNGERLTYNNYIEAQIRSIGQTHSAIQMCLYNIPLEFKGRIEKTSNGHICFQRIFISGMYPDGICFDNKEDHVWMEQTGFEGFKEGDCVKFFAEPYRYLKTGNGKQIDYALRNPAGIKKIESYELPSDDEIIEQELNLMLCETCFLSESCYRMHCINEKWRSESLKRMKDILKQNDGRR